MIGTTISHYQILEKIGEGGMGQVFKARDTKLDRMVALKFLSSTAVDDAGKERFYREAHAAASLNHPNIAYVFNIEDHDRQSFITMEFVEGQTLHDLLHRREKPLPIKTAIQYAIQIATGLDAAHKKNIIHRDIKSANIMVMPNHSIKIMDFGLAKLIDNTMLTQDGSRMGTAAYMSPEQADGDQVDFRTDIWSLGVVLYEMICGQLPFRGDIEQAVIYSILQEQPKPLTALRTGVPMELERIIFKCLSKNPKHRYQHADELIADLDILLYRYDNLIEGQPISYIQGARKKKKAILIFGIGAVLILSALSLFVSRIILEPEKQVVRFKVDLPDGRSILTGTSEAALAFSRDGRKLVIAVDGNSADVPKQLFMLNMDAFEAAPIPNSKHAYNPFFSPNGEFIGFNQHDSLRTMSIYGGQAKTLYTLPRLGGAFWGDDNSIIFEEYGLYQTDVDDINVKRLSYSPRQARAPDLRPTFPQLLPGGDAVLFTLKSELADSGKVVIFHISGDIDTIAVDARMARYIASGHIVYTIGNDLYAVPFNVKKKKVAGDPVLVLSGIVTNKNCAQYAISDNGSLAYISNDVVENTDSRGKLVWVDRQGHEKLIQMSSKGGYFQPRLSPDNRKLLYWRAKKRFVMDLTTGKEHEFVGKMNAGLFSAWMPDSRNIVYNSYEHGGSFSNLFIKPWDNSEPTRQITFSDSVHHVVYDVSPQKDIYLLGYEQMKFDLIKLMRLPFSGNTLAQPIQLESFMGVMLDVSPDGRWLAYTWWEKDQPGYIAVRPLFSAGSDRIIASPAAWPVWSGDGKELFFRRGQKMMSLPIRDMHNLKVGEPVELFSGDYKSQVWWSDYTVTNDGQKFVMIKEQTEIQATEIHIVLNWFEELKTKMRKAKEAQKQKTFIKKLAGLHESS